MEECIQKFGDPDVEPEVGEEEELLKESFEQICGYVTDTVVAIEENPSLSKPQKHTQAVKALSTIRDKLLHLKLIFIELDDEDDAYIAFETLNTRGLDLTVAHLVKNHLTKLLRTKNARVDLPKEKWAKLVGILEESEARFANRTVSSPLLVIEIRLHNRQKALQRDQTPHRKIEREGVSRYARFGGEYLSRDS